MRSLLVMVLVLAGVAGCAEPAHPSDSVQPSNPAQPSAPAAPSFPVGAAVDYQLGGAYPLPAGVRLVARDVTASPASDAYNICYVNGFQTQPAERDLWLRERHDLVLFDASGNPVIDENWPDELIVDTSTADKRARLADIVGETVKTCASKGFNAVEFDNLDSYSRSNGALTVDDNLAFATALATVAHAAGMVAGQKNSADLGRRGQQEAKFDFAVAEECLRFQECATYASSYGDRLIDIEYTDDLPAPVDTVCALPNRPKSMVIRDRKLVTPSSQDYFYRHC
ncbi:endo alpha-1,4 polygalactosaminidase [Kutzneria sp. CA-103260]|uniref:endo alpha-1,4 polygalactosaminidase n=1 Tax=Kutzneria sp. CA-103260 TaxID=2802641 RepID=UPI001BEF3E2E|nr:endo alpha-1,4 polygalactosaminidase [Kutzneria sp. CA-103260]QUQ63964.1 Glycoside-hydrolase family GH114 [Kutzneria sp. CA-103260]